MPIYEFRCAECGHVFEKLFFHSDSEADMSCPECRCSCVERVVSRTHHTVGAGPGANQPRISSTSCGAGNRCMTLDLPGPAK